MKIALIAFSGRGAALAERIAELDGHESSIYVARRHHSILSDSLSFSQKKESEAFDSVYELTARLFYGTDALVFIGACGIAVRAVAPLVQSKLTDPAVVVCDETGRFAVSLLSGHVGGANRLTKEIAAHIGATPVVTTASDAHAVPGGAEKPLVLGIGCRRGLSAETIERIATILLWDAEIPLARVREIATIDKKRDEAGLLAFAEAHNLPLRFYSAEQLSGVPGEFSSSERVLQAVGVDNVCERAAVLCGGNGKLIINKTAKDGVTVAVFEREIMNG